MPTKTSLSKMKRRILNYRVPATHGLISELASFFDPASLSDYDAFLIDPGALGSEGHNAIAFARRQNEVRELLMLKGGVMVSVLRPNTQLPGNLDRYSLLQGSATNVLALMRGALREGDGSSVSVVATARGAMNGYFRVMRENLRFSAYLDASESDVVQAGGTVFAVNSIGKPIAVEFVVGSGRLCFLPVPQNVPGDRVGAAIAQIIEAHFGGSTEVEEPSWVKDSRVPGADAHDLRIAELEAEKGRISEEIARLTDLRTSLLNFRRLLFGTGTTVLEPAVRGAFRQIGFEVPEPEDYEGEWDVELREASSGRTAIAEVEGPEGPIDVDKYRQLLDYFQTEVLEGRVHKGILVGNGYRLKELNAPERQNQFTEHALRGAKQNGFCLLPTSELFKAVCAVLDAPENEGLKMELRNSILTTVGVWSFSREENSAARVADSSAPLGESAAKSA